MVLTGTQKPQRPRGLLWFAAFALPLPACAAPASRPAAPSAKATPTVAIPDVKPSVTADKLAVAAGCVTQAPEPLEVGEWRALQLKAIAGNLSAAASCFPEANQPAYVQVELERQTPSSSDVWIVGTSATDCTITECVAGKLRSTALPEPPAKLPSATRRIAQVILGFASNRTPQLRLSSTPNVPLLTGRCVDQSRLPKSGQLSAAHIRDRVRAAASKLRECYEQGLARDPGLNGQTVFRFTIATDGSVQTVELKSNSLPDCQAVGCMSDVGRLLHFDPPQGGPVSVVYPFAFQPVD